MEETKRIRCKFCRRLFKPNKDKYPVYFWCKDCTRNIKRAEGGKEFYRKAEEFWLQKNYENRANNKLTR